MGIYIRLSPHPSNTRPPCPPRLSDGGPHRPTPARPRTSATPRPARPRVLPLPGEEIRPSVSGCLECAGRRDGGVRRAPVARISPAARLGENWSVNF
ncbi:hypothetical protein EJB05_38312, partial [Eragrostis curvula]